MAADATPAVSSLKEQGNASLKQGDLKSACAFYTEALAEALPADEAAAVHCNRALARLKLKETAACIADCSLAIGFQPGYAKAFYRRAQAYEASQKLADAFKDLREVLRLEPANREAQQFAARLKQAIEMRNATADLSTPSLAVETLRGAAAGLERVQAVGKLSKIADDKERAVELLHAGAVPVLVALLPAKDEAVSAATLALDALLAVEALERMAQSDDPDVLRAIGAPDDAAAAVALRVRAVAVAAADAKKELPADDAEGAAADGAAAAADGDAAADGSMTAAQRRKNVAAIATRAISLLASLAGRRSAAGDQDAQGKIVGWLLELVKHDEEGIKRSALDGILRVADKDREAMAAVLPAVLLGLMRLLGDDDSEEHRIVLAILSKCMARVAKPHAKDNEEAENTPALCAACEASISKVLRAHDVEWDDHVAAVHAVTAVLEVNKEVGGWLLRQESIFWSLAEVAELDDEDLQKSLAEVYAHAANDAAHFREKAGDEPIKHLKAFLKSPKPKVRSRACVALAKVALLHHQHRPTINPTGKLLTATLGLLEAKVPPSVHRWAVEALMFLTVMPDTKEHLVSKGVAFGSLTALAESVGKDSSFHFSLVSAFRRLCVPRKKSDEEKRLEHEMEPAQIEQMRQMSAGPGGAAPKEREDNPNTLAALAARLVNDDATLVVAELVAHTQSDSLKAAAADVLLAMAQTVDGRGKMVQQGGWKAALGLALHDDAEISKTAAWALAKIAISINPIMYPRRIDSNPESMVKPLLKLVDTYENELQAFEGCLALCNLATVDELKERMVKCGAWRTVQMTLTSNNEQLQRAALEVMCNLCTHDEIIERFCAADSQELRIFIGFAQSDDPKAVVAATGALATLLPVPEIGERFLQSEKGIEAFVEIALNPDSEPALLHRAAVGLKALFAHHTDALVGTPDADEPPAHALVVLGSLMMLSKVGNCPPAKQAAVEAIVALRQARPDVALPPHEAVAQVVERIKAEAEKRAEELRLEEEEAAAEAAAAAAEKEKAEAQAKEWKKQAKKAQKEAAAAGGVETIDEGEEGLVEDDDDDDDDDDGTMV